LYTIADVLDGSGMKLDKRKPSGREKDEASVKLLEQLRQKLHSEDPSVRRLAAFKLAWMQEDGLDILKEALFADFTRTTRMAAAYGLRKTQGRMKKKAFEVIQEGLKSRNNATRQACNHALRLLRKKPRAKAAIQKRGRKSKIEIRDITNKRQSRRTVPRKK